MKQNRYFHTKHKLTVDKDTRRRLKCPDVSLPRSCSRFRENSVHHRKHHVPIKKEILTSDTSIMCTVAALQKPASDIGAICLTSTPYSGANFSCQCMTSNSIDCLQGPKAVSASARKTGAIIWRRIYGADFCSWLLGTKMSNTKAQFRAPDPTQLN